MNIKWILLIACVMSVVLASPTPQKPVEIPADCAQVRVKSYKPKTCKV
jgi:hypothetical protein